MSGIYQIQSKKKPERIYIGSAINIHVRWMSHLKGLRKNKHHSKTLQRHFNKYGEADLQFSVLAGCDKEDLIRHEQYFLDAYRPYFNTLLVAGSVLGLKHSDETKRKISELQKGKKRGKRPNWNYPPWNKGKKATPEAIKNQSESHKGKKMPEEQRLKMLGRKTPEATLIKMKGKIPWNKGKVGIYSEETKLKMSNAKKGKPSWNKNKPWAKEIRKKISEAQKGKPNPIKGTTGRWKHTEETKLKMSEKHKGIKPSREARLRMSEAQKNKSDETKRKISEALMGNKNGRKNKSKLPIINLN